MEQYVIGRTYLDEVPVRQVRDWASLVAESTVAEDAADERLRDRIAGLINGLDTLRLRDIRSGILQSVSVLVRAWDEIDLDPASLPEGIERSDLERFEVRRHDSQLDEGLRAALFGDDEAGRPRKVIAIDTACTELGRDVLNKLHGLRVSSTGLDRVRLDAVRQLAGQLYCRAVELGLENRAADLKQALEAMANLRVEHLRRRAQMVADVIDIWNRSTRASYTLPLKLRGKIQLNQRGDSLAKAALKVTLEPDRRAAGEIARLDRAVRAGRPPATIADLRSRAGSRLPRLDETKEILVSFGTWICARGSLGKTGYATAFSPPLPLGELLDVRLVRPGEANAADRAGTVDPAKAVDGSGKPDGAGGSGKPDESDEPIVSTKPGNAEEKRADRARPVVKRFTARRIAETLRPVVAAILESSCGTERTLAFLSDPAFCISFGAKSEMGMVALRCANFAVNTVSAPLLECPADGILVMEPLWVRERGDDGSVHRKPVRIPLLRTDQGGEQGARAYYQAMTGWIAAQDITCGRNLRNSVHRKDLNALYRWTIPLRIPESFFLSHLDVTVAGLQDPVALSLYEEHRDEIALALYFGLIGVKGFLDELSHCEAIGTAVEALYRKMPARLRKAVRGHPFLFDPAFGDRRVGGETVELARALEQEVGQWAEPRRRLLRRGIKELLLCRMVRAQCRDIADRIALARRIDGPSDEVALGRALAVLYRGELPPARISPRLPAIALAMFLEQRDAGDVDLDARIELFRRFTEEWIAECETELFANIWRDWGEVESRIAERIRCRKVNAALDGRIEQDLLRVGVQLPRIHRLRSVLRFAYPVGDLVELFMSALVERFGHTLERFGCGGPFRWPKSLRLSALNGKTVSGDIIEPLQYRALMPEHVIIHQQALGLDDAGYFQQYRGFFPFADVKAYRAFIRRLGPVYVASVQPHPHFVFLLREWPRDPDLLPGFLDGLGWSPYNGKKHDRLAKIRNLLALPGDAGPTCRTLDQLDLAELKALGEFLGFFTKTADHQRLILEPPPPLSYILQ